MNFSPEDFKRLYWHSRRGMLELDLLLVPFAEKELLQLGAEDIVLYELLLAEEDQDLFVWLTQRQPAPSPELQKMVDMVLQSNADRESSQEPG